MMNVSLTPYVLVKPEYFAFVPVTSRNGEKITLAYNDTDKTYIVSSAYIVFRAKDKNKLDPEYLFDVLQRSRVRPICTFQFMG